MVESVDALHTDWLLTLKSGCSHIFCLELATLGEAALYLPYRMLSGTMAGGHVPFYCPTPGHKNPALNGESSDAALQMRCISCGADGRALTLNDTS